MKREINYIIRKIDENKTIEQFLKAQGYPHPAIVHLKKTPEGIRRNGIWAYVTERLSENDQLSITLIETDTSPNITPIRTDFSIVYEDEDICIINKPANMPIHPSINHSEGTLANGLMYYFSNQNLPFVFRCINRLDKDTTGLTIVAKHLLSGSILSQQVSQKEIWRTYQAICQGFVPENGTIDAPIARMQDSILTRCVKKEGKRAITHYHRLAYCEKRDLSLVELSLETGRTHQIRVHMQFIGHPIIGDFLYNPDYTYIQRQALHSASLTFVHPITKQDMHFSAPLPLDMKCLFESI